MICPLCRAENANEWQFCQRCGQRLHAIGLEPPPSQPTWEERSLPSQSESYSSQPVPLPPPPVGTNRMIKPIVSSIIAAAIALILIFAVLLNPAISPLSTIHDTDGDGHPDSADIFPNDLTEWKDSDGDGHGDNSDAFPTDATEWIDTDNDGYGDNSDLFPTNATEWKDSDGDGHGDNSDAFPTDATEWKDSDGDGYGDNSDAFPADANEWTDTDGDGFGDNSDAFPYNPTEWIDSDGDGHGDNSDAFPNDPTDWKDSDADGHGDHSDAFPTDPTEWMDSDGDGHGDNSDVFPYDPTRWLNPFDIEYNWSYGGYIWTLTVSIPGEDYYYYKDQPRTLNFPIYVTDTDLTVFFIANLFKSNAQSEGYDSYQTASFVLAFVQSLPYTSDINSTGYAEYPRYPVETLVDEGGDCEDTAILYAAIMQASPLNYDAILISPPGHMATGIWTVPPIGWYYTLQGRDYSYCETTGEGWDIGEMPAEYQGVGANLYQV